MCFYVHKNLSSCPGREPLLYTVIPPLRSATFKNSKENAGLSELKMNKFFHKLIARNTTVNSIIKAVTRWFTAFVLTKSELVISRLFIPM